MPSKTRKVKSTKVLKVDAKHKIPKFEQQIKAGTINFVLVYAEWCGACHRFMDNIWNPMCKGKAKHNRVAVRDDMIKGTSLANANFDYLPSVLIVDEAGQLQSFKTPEGKDTNAMPTPKSLSEMKQIVNVPVAERKNTPFVRSSSPTRALAEPEMPNIPEAPKPSLSANSPRPSLSAEAPKPSLSAEAPALASNRLTTEEPEPMGTPAGVVYRPTPMAAPPQKGGRRNMRFPKEFMRRFGLAFTRRLKR